MDLNYLGRNCFLGPGEQLKNISQVEKNFLTFFEMALARWLFFIFIF